MTMTNPMLAELDEVVRLSERATQGKVELHTSCSWRRIVAERGRPFLVPTIDPDRHQNMDTTESAEFVVALVNWFRTHHATLADMARRLEAAERDARMWRLCNSDHPFSDGTTVKCHVNVGVNIWEGDEWLEFHSCSPEQLEQVLQKDAIDATQEGEG